jgi:hypothetical protein
MGCSIENKHGVRARLRFSPMGREGGKGSSRSQASRKMEEEDVCFSSERVRELKKKEEEEKEEETRHNTLSSTTFSLLVQL